MFPGRYEPSNPDWMANLPGRLRRKPLNTLAIPGSHDSGTFYLNEHEREHWWQLLNPVVNNYKVRWGKTQSLNFRQQLEAGIRYFDMRIKYMGGNFHIVHNLCGSKVQECLRDMENFLKEHPKEVILVDMNHFYEMDGHHKEFIEMVLSYLGNKACPRHMSADISKITLEMMWKNNFQVIIFYDHDNPNSRLWPGSKIKSPWLNTDNEVHMVQMLDRNLTSDRPSSGFYVSQGVLTPGKMDVAFSWSLESTLSTNAARKFVPWLTNQPAGEAGINICIMDFVEMNNYIQTVINLNR